MSGATPLRWFLRAVSAVFALMLVVAVVHHWWWVGATGLLGASSSMLQLRELKRKAAKNQALSN